MSKKILTLIIALLIAANLSGCNQPARSSETSSPVIPEPTTAINNDMNENKEKEQTSEEDPSRDDTEEDILQEKTVYVSAYKLSVRAESNLQSNLLGSLSKGEAVTVVEEVINEESAWYKIRFENADNHNEGWILSQYTVEDLDEIVTPSTPFDDKSMNDYFTSPTLFDDNIVVAYYGHPKSEIMGIVGRHSKEELLSLLQKQAEEYDAVNGTQGVIPAIYLVYGTVQPEGRISKMKSDLVMSYIEFAYENGVLVYLDHQIGRYSPIEALKEILPFLKYPNVHLALDPEWRTDKPMKELGYLRGTEINEIQETMREYIISNAIQGKRQFVFHQFQKGMIRDIEAVSSQYDPVLLVHNTSGWGSSNAKIATHTRNAVATNIPYKGFKLWYFYKPEIHYDNPLMTPEQVLGLDPKPGLIIYQ